MSRPRTRCRCAQCSFVRVALLPSRLFQRNGPPQGPAHGRLPFMVRGGPRVRQSAPCASARDRWHASPRPLTERHALHALPDIAPDQCVPVDDEPLLWCRRVLRITWVQRCFFCPVAVEAYPATVRCAAKPSPLGCPARLRGAGQTRKRKIFHGIREVHCGLSNGAIDVARTMHDFRCISHWLHLRPRFGRTVKAGRAESDSTHPGSRITCHWPLQREAR